MGIADGFVEVLDQTLVDLRALAEARMKDTCTVSYKTGETTQDETTGATIAVYAVRFTSRCKAQANTLATGDADVGGGRTVVDRLQVHLPWDCPQSFPDDVIEITAIAPTTTPRLLGRKFIVGAPMDKTDATATRLNVQDGRKAGLV